MVIAVMLCPFLLSLLWLINGIGTEDTTDYAPPDPFWEVLAGAVFYSLVLAFVAVAVYRLSCWLLKRDCHA